MKFESRRQCDVRKEGQIRCALRDVWAGTDHALLGKHTRTWLHIVLCYKYIMQLYLKMTENVSSKCMKMDNISMEDLNVHNLTL